MKQFISILLFSLFLPVQDLQAQDRSASFDAMVVITIADLDDASLARLRAELAKDEHGYLEYSCTWSGVVVVKYSGIALGEPADVTTLMRRQLGAAGLERGVEFVHVQVEARGLGKC